MKKIIIITIVTLTTATGMLSSQTPVKQNVKSVASIIAPSTTAFRKDLGQAD